MSLRFIPRSGPLARVAASTTKRLQLLAEAAAPPPSSRAPASSRAPGARTSTPPVAPTGAPDPAVQLGRLVDLAGSVKLSRVLAEPARAQASADPSTIATCRRRVADELDELEADARAVIARVLRRKDDARTTEIRLGEEAGRALVDGHRAAIALRRSVGIDLAAASPEAAKLERLAAAIDEAIDAQVEARLARIAPAITAAHPDDVPALASALESALLAALAFDRRRIEALVDACGELATRSTPSPVLRQEAISA